MKKLATILTIAILITSFSFGITVSDSYATAGVPEIIAEAGILIDGTTGQILYTKNEHMRLEPASTTKMITCLLALENLDLNETLVIDSETPFTEGSRIYLEEGEEITVENVLYALMLESANDAAVALGKRISGTIPEFAAKMNARAKELGALNTTYVNPNGLHEEGHLSTVYDLAMIAKGCMENEMFRTLCSTYYWHIDQTNEQDERHLYNTNRLLYDTKTKVPVGNENIPAKYEGCIGIKTGYTSHAGGCLVAAAERNGTYLIACVMKSTDAGRFGDCISLLDYGFNNYHTVQAIEDSSDVGRCDVLRGSVKTVGLKIKNDVFVTLPIEASSSVLTSAIEMADEVKAPVNAGDVLGTYKVYESGTVVATADIIATEDVPEGTFLSVFGIEDEVAHKIFAFTWIIVGLIVILVAAIIFMAIRRERRRKARRRARAMEIAIARAERQKSIEQRDWRF